MFNNTNKSSQHKFPLFHTNVSTITTISNHTHQKSIDLFEFNARFVQQKLTQFAYIWQNAKSESWRNAVN